MNHTIKNYLFVVFFLLPTISKGIPVAPIVTGLSRAVAYTALLAAPALEKLITASVTPMFQFAGCSYPSRNSIEFFTHEVDKDIQDKIKSSLEASKSDVTWPKDQLGLLAEKTILQVDNKCNVAEVNYRLTDLGLEQTFKFPKQPFAQKATEDEVVDLYCAYIERENNEPMNINQRSREEKLRSYAPGGDAYCEALYRDPFSYYNLCMRYKDGILRSMPALSVLSALPLYCIDKKITAKICSTALGAFACAPARIVAATVVGLGLTAIQYVGEQKIKSHHEETKDAYLPDSRVPIFKKHLQGALRRHEKNEQEQHRFHGNSMYKLPPFAAFATYNKLMYDMQKQSLERRIAQLQTREDKIFNTTQNKTTTDVTSTNE